jgi:hypothetical protein
MISPEIVALIGAGAGAFVAAWRKFNTAVGSAHGSGESLRDMIVKLDGKLDGMSSSLESKIDHVTDRVRALESANDNEPTRPDHRIEKLSTWKRRK